MKKLFFCKTCISFSSRPRIKFNSKGECSACQWAQEKKKINWKFREKQMMKLFTPLDKTKKIFYDCIVAVSGGKDGSFVAHNLKNKFKKRILTVTVKPPLQTHLGTENLNSFIQSGYENLLISPDPEAMRVLNKLGLEYMGFPYYGWLVSIHTALIRVASNMKIPLIFYSEDGEVEYGGDTKFKNNITYDINYQKSHYLEGGYDKIIKLAKKNGITESQLYWFTFPSEKEIKKFNVKITHYSYFENWDPYKNYLIAKEKCGLKENELLNKGTYTNFAQTDQELYQLHVYLMYLKFGFGRATQDACIDIRRGSMSREQGLELSRLYDNSYPEHLFKKYCEYYKINQKKLHSIFDKWANKKLFEKKNRWIPKFKIF